MHISLKLKVRVHVYETRVRSAMLYGSETWAMKAEQEATFERIEMRMIRWMSGESLKEKKTSAELRARMGLKSVGEIVRGNRLRWLGHVLRKDPDVWVRSCMDYEVDGKRPRGRPEKAWMDLLEKDMEARGLSRGDATDREVENKCPRLQMAYRCISGECGHKTRVCVLVLRLSKHSDSDFTNFKNNIEQHHLKH